MIPSFLNIPPDTASPHGTSLESYFTRVNKGWCNGKKRATQYIQNSHVFKRSHLRQSGKIGFKGRKELEEISSKRRLQCARTVKLFLPDRMSSHKNCLNRKWNWFSPFPNGGTVHTEFVIPPQRGWSNFHCGGFETATFQKAYEWVPLSLVSLTLSFPSPWSPSEQEFLQQATPEHSTGSDPNISASIQSVLRFPLLCGEWWFKSGNPGNKIESQEWLCPSVMSEAAPVFLGLVTFLLLRQGTMTESYKTKCLIGLLVAEGQSPWRQSEGVAAGTSKNSYHDP